MAPVIWGLDLAEIQMHKFKHSYMFAHTYHLQRAKMLVYQLAMILCVVGESLITSSLDDYIHHERKIREVNPNAIEHNNNIVGIGSYTIFCGVAVATVFGAGFFFDLFWPERHESRAVKLAWKWSALFVTICLFADCLAQTIIIATASAYISNVDDEAIQQLITQYPKPPLRYRNYGRNVASCVFLWCGLPATIASTIILWKSYAHNEKYGPKARHLQEGEAELKKTSPSPPPPAV